jgi:DNA-cytosine methyltransferase
MNVLSLFDGMSCGRIALDRLGIKVDNYYASEIDKYAIQVSQANYPDIIQVGDITELDLSTLPKIDLVMGGSPCQGFSFAGKQLAFDDPRSALFFEFVRCVEELKPKYFLLENVRMKKEYLDVISEYMGVEPIMINSALVSAQNRVRYYWTNIPGIEQPEQRGIVLRDILETNPDNNLSKMTTKDDKSFCLTSNYHGAIAENSIERKQRTMIPTDKPVKVGMNVEQVKIRKHEVDIISLQYLLREMKKESSKTNKQIAEETNTPITKAEHWFRTDSSFAIPSDEIWLKLKEVLGIETDVFDKQIMEFEYRDGVYESKQRVYSENGKSPTLTAGNKEQYIETHDTPKQVGIATDINGHDILKRVYSPDGKSPTVNACTGGNREPKVLAGAFRGRYKNDGSIEQKLELRQGGKTNSLTTVQKDNVVVSTKPNQINPSKKANGVQPYMQDRVFHVDGKSHCLTKEFAARTNVGDEQEVYWRKLTPVECERLQTVPDNYTDHVSNTQRYKMLGNGWTIEVIAHILKKIKIDI